MKEEEEQEDKKKQRQTPRPWYLSITLSFVNSFIRQLIGDIIPQEFEPEIEVLPNKMSFDEGLSDKKTELSFQANGN
jgi:hypothetical protein